MRKIVQFSNGPGLPGVSTAVFHGDVALLDVVFDACIFIEPSKGTVQDVRPMAGWATWKRSVVDGGGKTLIEAGDPFVEAIVIDGGWPVCAQQLESDSFTIFDYLLPGQEAPKIGELAPGLDPGLRGKGDKPFKRNGRPGQGRQAPR